MWDGTLGGGFSINSDMVLIQTDTQKHENPITIWRLVAHNHLMTNDNSFIQTLTDDPSYGHCATPEENIIHLLGDCTVA